MNCEQFRLLDNSDSFKMYCLTMKNHNFLILYAKSDIKIINILKIYIVIVLKTKVNNFINKIIALKILKKKKIIVAYSNLY